MKDIEFFSHICGCMQTHVSGDDRENTCVKQCYLSSVILQPKLLKTWRKIFESRTVLCGKWLQMHKFENDKVCTIFSTFCFNYLADGQNCNSDKVPHWQIRYNFSLPAMTDEHNITTPMCQSTLYSPEIGERRLYHDSAFRPPHFYLQ